MLRWDDVRRYAQVDPGNARMRWLMDRVIGSGAWRLLWLPPSRPNYQLGGAFSDPKLAAFTKTLVFSSWQSSHRSCLLLSSSEPPAHNGVM